MPSWLGHSIDVLWPVNYNVVRVNASCPRFHSGQISINGDKAVSTTMKLLSKYAGSLKLVRCTENVKPCHLFRSLNSVSVERP
jgi:hypothetical protein